MPNTYGNVIRPASLMSFARMHNLDPRWVAHNIPNLWHSFYFRRDDFDQALDTNQWTAAVTGGGAPTAFAYNAQRCGALRGATGTTDDGFTVLHNANVAFDAADNPGMYIRFLAPAAVTGFGFEIGFMDSPTSEVLKSVTALTAAAVPTVANGVTDIAAVCMDTDYTLTTMALVGDGTTGSPAGAAIGTLVPTAARFMEIIIEFSANRAQCQVWNDGIFEGQYSVGNGPDSGTLVRPSAVFCTRNTTTKVVDIDQIILWCERNRTS